MRKLWRLTLYGHALSLDVLVFVYDLAMIFGARDLGLSIYAWEPIRQRSFGNGEKASDKLISKIM